MPIEIRELVIKATISTEKKNSALAGGGTRKKGDSENDNEKIQKIINEVSSIIKNKEER